MIVNQISSQIVMVMFLAGAMPIVGRLVAVSFASDTQRRASGDASGMAVAIRSSVVRAQR